MPANIEIVATLPPMHPGEMLREEYLKPLKSFRRRSRQAVRRSAHAHRADRQ